MTRPPRDVKVDGSAKGQRSDWPVGIGIEPGAEPPPRQAERHQPPPAPRVPTKQEIAAARRLAKTMVADVPPSRRARLFNEALLSVVHDTAAAATEEVLRRYGITAGNGPSERRAALAKRRAAWISQFGERIQAERERMGFTQGAFAKAVGMPQSHLSQLENGKLEARLSTLYAFANVLKVRPGMLLAFTTM